MTLTAHNHKSMKVLTRPSLFKALIALLVFAVQAEAASSHTFATFDVGTLTGGGAAFTKSLDVSGLPNSEYLFVRVTATHTSGAAPHDGWSNTIDMELSDGGSTVYWPSNTATMGAMGQDGTSSLIWSGLLPKNTYQGGHNLTIKFVDTYSDTNGTYYSTMSNVMVTIYPSPTPAKAFATFDVGALTGGGAAFTKSLDVSGLPNSEYLFVRVTATHASGAAPHDAWSNTMDMELSDGGSTVYWPSNTATMGAMSQAGTSSLIWAGVLPKNTYQGGHNLTIKFVDTYSDTNGTYYSTMSNVMVTIYPSPTPAKTFATFDVGTLTGGGTAFTKSLDVSGLPNSEYLFVRVTATHTSAAAPHDAWSNTMDMELSDGGSTVYWPSNTATMGAMSQAGTSSLIWSGVLPKNTYQGGHNLTIKFVDTYSDTNGTYYSTMSNVVVAVYPAVSAIIARPQLTIGRSGTNMVITWPTNATGFTLQAATNLASPVIWAAVSPLPAVVNGQNTVTNPISGPRKFYELSQ
jgi:hypothetical protein